MNISKQIVMQHLQAKVDEGYSQKDIAKHLGFPNPNFVSMLMSEKYPKTLLSMNRLKAFASFCNLTAMETLRFAIARIADSGDAPLELSKSTMLWLFRVFGEALKARIHASGAGA